METYHASPDDNYKYREEISHDTLSVPDADKELKEEFEPKFKQLQEDFRYMFKIEVPDEDELQYTRERKFSYDITRQMYNVALKNLQEGDPFSLEYFIEEGLLYPYDIRKEDALAMKPYALTILKNMRNIPRLNDTKNLFLQTGILTEDEVNMSPTIH